MSACFDPEIINHPMQSTHMLDILPYFAFQTNHSKKHY